MTEPLEALLSRARALSWERFGRRLTLYLPGMFVLDGKRGRYPAISISGAGCVLQCDHCAGQILKPMLHAMTPEDLVETCKRLQAEGMEGCLITGGSDREGRLPWDRFLEAIAQVKDETGLHLSVHSGMVDKRTAVALKEAGVDQALLDVVGAEETFREVLHLEGGEVRMRRTLAALDAAGLEMIPHIVMGIHFGRILGERRALQMLIPFRPKLLVWVMFMPLRHTPMQGTNPLPPDEAAWLLAESRLLLPHTEISLGCARPRGRIRAEMERLAILAGVNRMALYSDETVEYARSLGLKVEFQGSCCSVAWQRRGC